MADKQIMDWQRQHSENLTCTVKDSYENPSEDEQKSSSSSSGALQLLLLIHSLSCSWSSPKWFPCSLCLSGSWALSCPSMSCSLRPPRAAELCIRWEGADKQNHSWKPSLFWLRAVSEKGRRVNRMHYTDKHPPPLPKKHTALSLSGQQTWH